MGPTSHIRPLFVEIRVISAVRHPSIVDLVLHKLVRYLSVRPRTFLSCSIDPIRRVKAEHPVFRRWAAFCCWSYLHSVIGFEGSRFDYIIKDQSEVCHPMSLNHQISLGRSPNRRMTGTSWRRIVALDPELGETPGQL